MRDKTVTKCVCHGTTFRELKEYACEQKLNCVDDLVKRKKCCCGCGMCYPYVQKMMQTGDTTFAPGDIY